MSEIQSLARGLHILDRIAKTDRSVSITELADELGIDKSSASRLVKTLVNYGYLQQESGSRRYTIGKRLYQLSLQLLNDMPIREKARPYLYRLVNQTGECAHTAVHSGGKALVIDDVETDTTLRVVGGVGRMIPLHCTAVGKGLLAFSDIPLPEELISRTQHTITDADDLRDHLAEIRALGYALDDEENDLGIRCMAAPVYNMVGMVIATIGISGPTVRISDSRLPHLAAQVMQAAAELSAELGYLPEEQQRDEDLRPVEHGAQFD